MSLRSMTFVTTRPNRCKHLWLSLLQKLIILISLTGCIAAPTAGCRPVVPSRRGPRWVLVIVRTDTGVCPYG